ncbi:MAG: AMP-binding protein, partial [Lachnospiraceae bacterium]|nr:AMP-binding protein [Lachnospiraceae bacterium]
MDCKTIRDIVVYASETYGDENAFRYKAGKNEIETKSYRQLQADSESFSRVLEALGEKGSHIAVTGMTSYPWVVTYFGTVNSGSVAVPL